jgi:hypothetical protein
LIKCPYHHLIILFQSFIACVDLTISWKAWSPMISSPISPLHNVARSLFIFITHHQHSRRRKKDQQLFSFLLISRRCHYGGDCYLMSVWAKVWACEQELEGIFQFIFHPCQLKYSLTNFDDMSKYTITKVYFATSIIIHMSSLPCGFATWTPNNNVFVRSNVNTKIYQGWYPMCWSKKYFWHIYYKSYPMVSNMSYMA